MTDLALLAAEVDWTDARAATVARERVAAGAGRLADLAGWIASTQGTTAPRQPAHARCLIVGGDVDGPVAAAADGARASVGLLAVPDGVDAALTAGLGTADLEIDGGTDLIVLAGTGPTPTAAALVSLITGAEPVALLPRGAAAVDTTDWITRAGQLRDTRRRITAARSEPEALLAALGSPHLAYAAGLLLGAVVRRTPVVLDGPFAVAAALFCYDVQSRTGRWWRVADTSADPVQTRAVDELVQEPVLSLGTARGDGLAGLLALTLIRTAVGLVGPTPSGPA